MNRDSSYITTLLNALRSPVILQMNKDVIKMVANEAAITIEELQEKLIDAVSSIPHRCCYCSHVHEDCVPTGITSCGNWEWVGE